MACTKTSNTIMSGKWRHFNQAPSHQLLRLLVKIEFVKMLAPKLVKTLFYQVFAAMDIDMKILIQF